MDKVTIRPILREDTPLILKWRNTESVKAVFIYQKDLTESDHLHWLESKVDTGLVAQFVIMDGSKPVGSVYLQDIDRVHNKAEFGIFLGEEESRNKGIGTTAARQILDYGFRELKLHRIYLRVYESNVRAIASYEKAGFRKEALLREDVYVRGAYHNMVLMAILDSEFPGAE